MNQNSDNRMINVQGGIKLNFLVFLLPFLRSLEGDMNLNLVVQPTLYNLRASGSVQLRRAFVQLTDTLEPFESIYSNMSIDRNILKINSFYSEIGAGRLQAGGQLIFQPNGVVPVDIKGSFERVRFTSIPGIFVQGSGQLSFTGDRFPYTLGLVARMTDARMEKEIVAQTVNQARLSSLLPKESKNTFEPIALDLKVSFDKPALVNNSMIKSSAIGNIHIKGFPTEPMMTGTITLPEGTITFREHEFDILSGKIKYTNAPPSNPLMDITARTTVSEYDMQSDVEHEYDILLRVRGSGYSPLVILSSTPDLTENEIISLLAFGTRSIVFETGSAVSDADKNSYYYYQLGTAVLEQAFGKELKNTLGVDQFSVISYRNPKKNSTSTKLTVGKKVSDKFTVSASQTFLEDNPESDIKAEYKIKKNVSLIGFWRNEDQTDTSDKGNNTVGFDVEYQLDF